MIQPQTYLSVADNSGARKLMCIQILGNNRQYANIGDIIVVLTNLAELEGVKVEDCIDIAYNVIAKRKGKMINGTFVKEQL